MACTSPGAPATAPGRIPPGRKEPCEANALSRPHDRVSHAASNWAWAWSAALIAQGKPFSHGELLVLIRVADHADHEGVCWPGERGLAKFVPLSERRVREWLGSLEAMGLLSRERQQRQKGRGRARDRILLALDFLPDDSSIDHPDASDRSTGRSEGVLPDDSGAESLQGNRQEEPPEESSTAFSPEVERLCSLMAERVNARTERKKPYRVTQAWRVEMRRLIEIDGRSPAEIEAAIEWVHRHDFWGPNILSVPKLRAKYDTLRGQAQRARNGHGGGRAGAVQSNVDDLEKAASEARRRGL